MGVVCLVIGGVAASGVGVEEATAQRYREPRIQERPAMAAGGSSALVWRTADATSGGRVHAALPAETSGRRLGPEGRGGDGRPTVASRRDGSTWVMASRSDESRSRLWTQRFEDGRWSKAERGPSMGRHDRYPVLAAGGDALWTVWTASDRATFGAVSALYAARQTDGAWTIPERLPQPPSEPMGAAMAVDDRGNPAVVWASGGAEAEIWLSWRGPSGWSAPLALTADSTPDISPSIAVSGDRWVIAWSSFRQRAYWTEAVVGHPRRGWEPPQRIARYAGSSPLALASEDGLSVVWAIPESSPGSTRSVVRWREFGNRGWRRSRDLVVSANANIEAAVAADGRLQLGWTNVRGDLTVAESDRPFGRGRDVQLRVLRGETEDAAAPSEVPLTVLPKISSATSWISFGDSITLGYTLVGGQPVIDPGYPADLRARLTSAPGTSVAVMNQGVGGERTPAGLARLSKLMGSSAAGTVIMEGTNDITSGFSPALIAFNLQKMAAMATKAGKTTVLTTVLPRNEMGFGGAKNSAIRNVNNRLGSAAATVGAALSNVYGAFRGRSNLYADHLHPSPAGYDVLGGVVFGTIDSMPSSGGTSPTTAAPGPPSGLQAIVSGTALTLNWKAPTTGGAPTSYRIQAGSAPGGKNLADFDTRKTATTFRAPKVGKGTYDLTVRAVNLAGTSGQSNNAVANVGVASGCSAAAAVPVGLTATANGRRVTLKWNAGSGESATSYRIEAGSGPGQANLANFDTGKAATTYVAGRVGVGTYYLRVRGVNKCGVSATSAEVMLIVS